MLLETPDDVKYALDRYTEIIKLRAAQVLALFIAYSLSLQASETFLDGPSFMAMVIPIAAWFFDLIARRQYMCPYAYAAIAYAYEGSPEKTAKDLANNLPNFVLDFLAGQNSRMISFFLEEDDELERRRKFCNWFTFKDQAAPAIIFGFFFFVAVYGTGGFANHEVVDTKQKAVEVTEVAPHEG